MAKPTQKEIDEAARKLQRGGLLGRGNRKKADAVVEQAVAAGADRQEAAMEILAAAANYEPRPWAR
jgi:hypothetical protein